MLVRHTVEGEGLDWETVSDAQVHLLVGDRGTLHVRACRSVSTPADWAVPRTWRLSNLAASRYSPCRSCTGGRRLVRSARWAGTTLGELSNRLAALRSALVRVRLSLAGPGREGDAAAGLDLARGLLDSLPERYPTTDERRELEELDVLLEVARRGLGERLVLLGRRHRYTRGRQVAPVPAHILTPAVTRHQLEQHFAAWGSMDPALLGLPEGLGVLACWWDSRCGDAGPDELVVAVPTSAAHGGNPVPLAVFGSGGGCVQLPRAGREALALLAGAAWELHHRPCTSPAAVEVARDLLGRGVPCDQVAVLASAVTA